jgi:hypothetical protein
MISIEMVVERVETSGEFVEIREVTERGLAYRRIARETITTLVLGNGSCQARLEVANDNTLKVGDAVLLTCIPYHS